MLARRDSTGVWSVVTLVAAAAAFAYVVSRTVGLPQLHDDIGKNPAFGFGTALQVSGWGTTLAYGFDEDNPASDPSPYLKRTTVSTTTGSRTVSRMASV